MNAYSLCSAYSKQTMPEDVCIELAYVCFNGFKSFARSAEFERATRGFGVTTALSYAEAVDALVAAGRLVRNKAGAVSLPKELQQQNHENYLRLKAQNKAREGEYFRRGVK